MVSGLAIILWHCANPMAPQGGPKDTFPPEILYLDPGNASTNLQKDQIRIFFDEFVQLKNVNDEVFISPPMAVPDFKIKGKSVVITFEEELEDSTTYSIFLGKSITDLTENNPLPYFSYVFSTGPVLDSLSLMGKVVNAFNLEPQTEALVMLYKRHYDTIPLDSVPYLIRPLYVTRTIEQGVFVLNNLKPGKYKMFVLHDINKNFLYDLPTEEIAFLDSLVIPEYFAPPLVDTSIMDTTMIDSTFLEADSLNVADSSFYILIGNDTINIHEDIPLPDTAVSDSVLVMPDSLADTMAEDEKLYNYYNLRMFREVDSTQKLLEAKLDKESLLKFVFRFPLKNPSISVMDTILEPGWCLIDWNQRMDTLIYWLPEIFTDSLTFIISDDTLVLDTVELPLKEPERKGRFSKKDDDPEPLAFGTNMRNSKMNLNGKAVMEFEYPVMDYDFSEVILIEEADTQFFQPVFTDTILRKKLRFDIPWKEKTSYEVIIPDSVITDILGRQNDSLNYRFTTKAFEDYGLLRMKVFTSDSLNPYIIQLLDEKDKLLKEDMIMNSAILKYNYLLPGKFKVKAIRDKNRNERWDTGDYLKNIQPEYVFYFPELIEVRANWEIEEEWEIISE